MKSLFHWVQFTQNLVIPKLIPAFVGVDSLDFRAITDRLIFSFLFCK